MARPITPTPLRLALVAVAAVLALAGCGNGDEVAEPAPTPEPAPAPTPDPTPAPDPTPPPAPTPEPTPAPDPEPDDDVADGVEPLEGEPSTEEQRVDAEAGTVAVMDVRVATHDGFDRVVLDIEGDGAAGWWTSYVDAARTAGKGEEIPLDGEAVLSVGVQGATLPPELPEGVEPWIGEQVAGAEGGVVLEVAGDTVFEGVHGIFLGLDRERPYLVERLDDPQRVVIDVFHD